MVCKKQKRVDIFSFVNIFLLSGFIFIIAVPALAETGNNIPTATIPTTQPSVPHGNEGAVPCQDPTGGSCVTPTQSGGGGQELFSGACVTFLGIGQIGLCPEKFAFGSYLRTMYAFLLAFVAIAAFGGITYGGLLYVLSAGSVSSTDEAKKWIWNALIGLFITAISFIILHTINPDLITNFNLDLSKYAPQSSGTPTIQGAPPGAGSACGVTLNACPGGYQCIFDSAGNGTCQPTGA